MSVKQVNPSGFNQLLAQCKKGKSKSQKQLYEQFYGYGMHICLRFAENREDAQEILNDGFLKAFTHLDRFDPAQPFKAWFRKILIHTAIDHHRSQKLHKGKVIPFTESHDSPQEQGLLTLLFPEGEVLPAIQALSPTYRMVFSLYVMEGYTHPEIGNMLGISATTSRSNLTRARLFLRNWIAEHAPQLRETYRQVHG